MTYVDTQKLTDVSGSIRSTNARIANAFAAVERNASSMDSAWNGNASQNAMTAYYRIKNTFPQPRYNSLESAARALDAIATGYNTTEEKNKTLAEQFK